MAKFDLKAAYRNVLVHPDDRWLLGMMCDDGLYVDTVLPFGLRSAPAIFNAVAEALAFVIRGQGVIWLDHYLDDFIVVGSPKMMECQEGLQIALETCCRLGFLVPDEKTVGPATLVTFLGIEVDSVGMQLRLPMVKLKKLKELVASWRKRKGCRKRELQSLAGHLMQSSKAGEEISEGHFGLVSQFGKRDHMIRLNAGFRADLEWWHAFLGDWNGATMICGGGLKQGERMVEI